MARRANYEAEIRSREIARITIMAKFKCQAPCYPAIAKRDRAISLSVMRGHSISMKSAQDYHGITNLMAIARTENSSLIASRRYFNNKIPTHRARPELHKR